MRVRVLPFGVLKDWLGATAATIELTEGATVADLLERLGGGFTQPLPEAALQGIAISVNAEYAQATHILREGDEVGLLPPVSGGCCGAARTAVLRVRRMFLSGGTNND